MPDDTKGVRIVETEAGRLVGRVDRIRRKVVWALVCPDCTHEIKMSEQEFTGHAPARCPCGWAGGVEAPLAEAGQPRYHDYSTVYETMPPGQELVA